LHGKKQVKVKTERDMCRNIDLYVGSYK